MVLDVTLQTWSEILSTFLIFSWILWFHGFIINQLYFYFWWDRGILPRSKQCCQVESFQEIKKLSRTSQFFYYKTILTTTRLVLYFIPLTFMDRNVIFIIKYLHIMGVGLFFSEGGSPSRPDTLHNTNSKSSSLSFPSELFLWSSSTTCPSVSLLPG